MKPYPETSETRAQFVEQLAEGSAHETIHREALDDNLARGELLSKLIEFDISAAINDVLEDDTAHDELLGILVDTKNGIGEITDAVLLESAVSIELVEKPVDDNSSGSLTRQIFMNCQADSSC